MAAPKLRDDLPEPPVTDLDPYAMAVLEDPHPFYRDLRETAPVVYFEKYGVYGVGRYAELREVVTDFQRFTASSGVGITDARDPQFRGRPPSALVEVDPPRHTDTRRVANRIMSPLVIRKWRSVFQEKAKTAVDRILEMGRFDGLRDLVEPVVFGGFPKAMGIRFDEDAIRAIGYMSFNQTGPENELYHKGLRAGEPFMDWFLAACQGDAVEPGSIAHSFFEAEAAGELGQGIASNITRSLVRGGMDTTISGISTAVRLLAQNADQWSLLKENPGRQRAVFDEAIRLEAPNHVVYRCTTGETELGGYALRGGVKIGTFPTAANRDPRKWDNPDSFDIMRNTANIHMSFGAEDHNCIGQNVARMEAESILAELLARTASIEPDGEPEYLIHNQLRTLGKLPLSVTPA
ncbi:MAG: cytochrome P450 [Rhizobiaceae bacterium]|nr:cytochrome P450 [Rhizobiaceae bacterium]MCV0404905.1 cytochrome P450 [Rhizobiaceae bacterium]